MSTNDSPSNQDNNNNNAEAPTGPEDKDTTPQSKQQKRQSQTSETAGTGTHELAMAVDDLLDQLQHKFDGVSSEIFGKLDDMTRRLDDLESSLAVSGDTTNTNQAK